MAINKGQWEYCRSCDGYHWYDWKPEKTGTNRIVARTLVNGEWVKTERVCVVAE